MDLTGLSDEELESRLKRCAAAERENLALLIEHLAEFEARRLALRKGFASLFKYCTKVLGYSESSAYKRINCVRAVERFPQVLTLIRQGKLHLEAVSILSPHLNQENHAKLLREAENKTSLELEALVSPLKEERGPRRDFIRAVSVPQEEKREDLAQNFSSIEVSAQPASEAATGLRIAFTASRECYEKLQRARQLLRHKFPLGPLEAIFSQALDDLLDKRDPDRRLERGPVRAGRQGGGQGLGRRIPQRVKDEVWKRDGGKCAYVGADGGRCEERSFLEYDHVVPYALGGRSDSAKNVRLLCRAHNQEASRRLFGRDRFSAPGPRAPCR